MDEAKSPRPSDEENALGFMLFSRPDLSLVFDNSVPHGDDKVRRLACSAAPGEYEPITFAAYALRDLKGATWRLAI